MRLETTLSKMGAHLSPVKTSDQLWDTASSLSIAPLLNRFENEHYPNELRCRIDELSHWLVSDCFFYSAIVRVSANDVIEPVSVASFLLVSWTSYIGFIRGRLREVQLKPWRRDLCSLNPVVYYSSFILSERTHGALLFRSLRRDFALYCSGAGKILPSFVFAVASNPSGHQHLSRHGFAEIGKSYLSKFPILQLTNPKNQADIWWSALHCNSQSKSVT